MKIKPFKPDRRILRRADVAQIAGVHVRTIDLWERTDPEFPRRLQLGKRALGYWSDEIENYLNSKRAPEEIDTSGWDFLDASK